MSIRPRTPAQQSASRQNGAKSHGPVTDIGKQRSSLNALKHGLCAASVLLPDEDEDDCQLLIDEYEQHYRPVTSLELARVREMALCDWRLRRTVEMERGLFTLALHDAAPMQQLVYGKENINLDQDETHAYAFRYSLHRPARPRPAATLPGATAAHTRARPQGAEAVASRAPATRSRRPSGTTERTQAGHPDPPHARRNTKRTRA